MSLKKEVYKSFTLEEGKYSIYKKVLADGDGYHT